MGCGTSSAVKVKEDGGLSDHKVVNSDSARNDWHLETSAKNGRQQPKNEGKTTADARLTFPNSDSSRASKKLSNDPIDSILLQGKTPGNMSLQERLQILSARRRSLQFEIGRGDDPDISGDSNFASIDDNVRIKRSSFRQPPAQDFPRRKIMFPPPPPRNASISSPTATRRKFSLTDSQKEFFRMLDEKVAQGKDYHSEDEKSISSLVSRKGSDGKLATILHALRSQHAR